MVYIIGDWLREHLLAGMLECAGLAKRPDNGGEYTYLSNLTKGAGGILIKRNATNFYLGVAESDSRSRATYFAGKSTPPGVVIVCFGKDGSGPEFAEFCNRIKKIENSRLLFVKMTDFKDPEENKNFYENNEGFYKLAQDCKAPYVEVNYPGLINMDKLLDITTTLVSNQGKKTKEQILRECLEAAIAKSEAGRGSSKFSFFSKWQAINKGLKVALSKLNDKSESDDQIIETIKQKTNELKDNKYTSIYSDLVADYEARKEKAWEDVAQETRLSPPLVKNARNLGL